MNIGQRFAALAIPLLLMYIVSTPASAQFLTPFAAMEQLDLARQVAQDSLKEDVVLLSVGSTGKINIGGLGTVDGFDAKTGKSNGWAYQFFSPESSTAMLVFIGQPIIGPPQVATQYGGDLIYSTDKLDVAGIYTNSDAFITDLKTDATYRQYLKDYPDVVPDAVILTFNPPAGELLPPTFPTDNPLWAIYFNANADPPDDSSMICFVNSYSGETHCIRTEVSGVEEKNESQGSVRLSLSPNPATGSGVLTLRIETKSNEGPIGEVGIYDMVGNKLLDLNGEIVPDGSGTFRGEIRPDDLPPGSYICRVVQGTTVRSIRFVVE